MRSLSTSACVCVFFLVSFAENKGVSKVNSDADLANKNKQRSSSTFGKKLAHPHKLKHAQVRPL